jgi:hypothetical protein
MGQNIIFGGAILKLAKKLYGISLVTSVIYGGPLPLQMDISQKIVFFVLTVGRKIK